MDRRSNWKCRFHNILVLLRKGTARCYLGLLPAFAAVGLGIRICTLFLLPFSRSNFRLNAGWSTRALWKDNQNLSAKYHFGLELFGAGGREENNWFWETNIYGVPGESNFRIEGKEKFVIYWVKLNNFSNRIHLFNFEVSNDGSNS